MRAVALLLVAVWAVFSPSPAAAADDPCAVAGGLDSASATCQWVFVNYSQTAASGDGHTWVVTIQCGNGGICAEYVECVENGEEGFMHDVFMDGTDVGDVCVPGPAVSEPNIAALVLRAFKNYDWPASKLVVQPPRGKTLVNLETNFYTANEPVITREITIAGRQVQIRATKTYTFNFGDKDSTTTASPGAAHPDGDVTHTYLSTGDVVVSLDTTYAGEFRIGDGDWRSIPDTLTVAGAGSDLEIVEALPQLVIR